MAYAVAIVSSQEITATVAAIIRDGDGGLKEFLVAEVFKHINSQHQKGCPKSLESLSLCNQPAAFYLWLRQVRQREAEQQLEQGLQN